MKKRRRVRSSFSVSVDYDDISAAMFDYYLSRLDQQVELLNSVRSRAIAVGTLSSAFAALFVGEKLEIESLWDNTPMLLAFLCFFFSIVSAVLILLPQSSWFTRLDAKTVFNEYATGPQNLTSGEFFEAMSWKFCKSIEMHERLLQNQNTKLFFSACLAFAQIYFWLFS
jgi:hypothetical protein